MDTSIWARLFGFIKASYTKRLKETFGGFSLAGFGFYHFFFDNVDPALIHTWIGVWLWVKTILSAYLASLATSLGSYHVELYKNKKNGETQKGRKRKKEDRAA